MTHFVRSENSYAPLPGDSKDLFDSLPSGNYLLKMSKNGFCLEPFDEFQSPAKIYGDCLKNCDRILNTFRSRGRNTGVMLVGGKGSGKTLLAREVCSRSELPVIIISESYTGDYFNSFLTKITQPAIVLFDEFEKVYDKSDQEKILTLLDGAFQSEKLFLFTSNNKWEIDANMKNRPGRIFYLLEFSGVDEKFIREYCADNLQDQSKTDSIVNISKRFDPFNFDMLNAFVEEVNRYGETPEELLSLLNAKPEYVGRLVYKLTGLRIGGIEIPLGKQVISVNTATDSFAALAKFHWDENKVNELGLQETIADIFWGDEEQINWTELISLLKKGVIIPGSRSDGDYESCGVRVYFEPEDITLYDSNNLVYLNDDSCTVSLIRVKKKQPALTTDLI